MGLFSKKINISEGKKYDINQISKDGVTQEEAVKKNKKLIEIFKAFNFNGGEKLEDIELAAAMDAFEKMDSQFGNKDGKLSKKELEAGAAWLNKEFGLEGDKAIDRKDLKEFIQNIQKAGKKDEKISTNAVKETYKDGLIEDTAKKNGYEPTNNKGVFFNKDENKYVKFNPETNNLQRAQWDNKTNDYVFMTDEEIEAADNPKDEVVESVVEEIIEDAEPPKTHKYVVQADEKFADIIKKSLAAQGIENPSKEEIEAEKTKFKETNPNAVKTAKNGVEFLMVGAEVNLSGKVESQKGSKAAIADWAQKHPAVVQESEDEDPDAGQNPPDAGQSSKKDTPVPTTKAEAAEALGLRETFAAKSKGIYYDEKTKTHYKWNEETKQFDAMDKSVGMVNNSGFAFDSKGQLDNFQLQTDGTALYKNKDGTTSKLTHDGSNRIIRAIKRDKNGKITCIYDKYSHNAEGERTNRRETHFNPDGKVMMSKERSVMEDGHLNVVTRDAKGKKLLTEIYKASIYDELEGKTPVSVTDDALISEYKNELVGAYSRLKVCSDEHPIVNVQNPNKPYIKLSTGDEVTVLKDEKGNITQIGITRDGDKDKKYDVVYYNDNKVLVQKDGVGEHQTIRNGTDFKRILAIVGPMFNK